MPILELRFNFGTELKNVNPTLYNQLNDLYTNISRVVNTKPSVNPTQINPPASSATNVNYKIGDIWINTLTDTAWIMTSRTTSQSVTWTQIT